MTIPERIVKKALAGDDKPLINKDWFDDIVD
jgi:hypothetical protein